MFKKVLRIVMSIGIILSLAGCGNTAAEVPDPEPSPAPIILTEENANGDANTVADNGSDQSEEVIAEEESEEDTFDPGKTLVVVFSATGNTKAIAEMIVDITGADFYEIVPETLYTDEDLNWNDRSSRSSIEQNDASSRPVIGSEPVSLEGYDTIFIGYPIWWAIEPRIMDTFVESYDFGDITVIPFCTSGSSGIGNSGKNLEALAGSGNWLPGKRFAASAKEEDVRAWIESIKK